MTTIGFPQTGRIHPIIALSVGVLLWFIPTLLLPLLKYPITLLLKYFGLIAASAGDFESTFASALILRWFAVALLLIFVLKIEKLPLSSLGIKAPNGTDFLLMLGCGVFLIIATIAIHLVFPFDASTQTGQIVSTLSILGKLHLILNAAIVEEIFYRGFLIERTTSLTHRIWLAGSISFILFIASHISGSGLFSALTTVLLGSLVFVLLYVKRRNLFTCIGAHAISNLLMFLA